jgi:hypothetical protein
MQPADPTSPQFSEENLRQLAAARTAYRKVGRAIAVASFDGWTIAIFAGLTLLMGITDLSNIVIGAGLGAIAGVELYGASKLRRLDGRAIRVLGFNQLTLGGLLSLYALWRIHSELSGGGVLASMAASDPQDSQQIGPLVNLSHSIVIAFYGALIAVAMLGMGAMALYYFSRRKYLAAYLSQTPDWILAMQKAGMSL